MSALIHAHRKPLFLFFATVALATVGAKAAELRALRHGTELFVDNIHIASQTNVTRTVHPARKLDHPVLVGENGAPARIYGTVHHDATTGEFRMWYGRSYATSRDGLRWEKPALEYYLVDGKPTNIVLPKGGGGVLVDELEPDPAKRYKALLAEPIKTGGFSGYYSADGLVWHRYGDDRLFTVGSEVGHIMRDPQTTQYFAYIRPYAPKHFPENSRQKRLGAVLTSVDFVHWSEMKVVLEPDAIDDAWVTKPDQRTEFYAMNGFAYGRSYLGIIPLFRITRIVEKTDPNQSRYDGPMEGQLITSRDGLNWSRMENRSPVIPSGPDFDQCIMNVAMAPLIVGDEVWHYYTAINATHGATTPPKQMAVALARWRLDGFVSLDAGAQEGVVETTLLNPGHTCRLEINADASAGALVVEVLDGNGQPMPDYTGSNAGRMTGDSVRHRATWKGRVHLPEAAFRLRFRLVNASLFSYTLCER